ncbi:hypothetical protein CDD83_841 [Cordyceps sp. RAO-2017]|nr:hypothetical protein CDD83_841 [Cordyceps sp. RAO-2017]
MMRRPVPEARRGRFSASASRWACRRLRASWAEGEGREAQGGGGLRPLRRRALPQPSTRPALPKLGPRHKLLHARAEQGRAGQGSEDHSDGLVFAPPASPSASLSSSSAAAAAASDVPRLASQLSVVRTVPAHAHTNTAMPTVPARTPARRPIPTYRTSPEALLPRRVDARPCALLGAAQAKQTSKQRPTAARAYPGVQCKPWSVTVLAEAIESRARAASALGDGGNDGSSGRPIEFVWAWFRSGPDAVRAAAEVPREMVPGVGRSMDIS